MQTDKESSKNSSTQQKHLTEQQSAFVERLLAWFKTSQRNLPWREDKDPYRIWVSEIMLQQTRVDTVIPYFHRFIEKFPDIDALADAPEEEVLKAWEGLGYYSRARNLQTAAREVKERYGGVVPDDPDEIASLKGVGPYTAGAILSIAYNRQEPAVDGNVMRVLSRCFLIRDDITKPSTRKKMEALIRRIIPQEAGDFNQALMELGALVCTPRNPQCLICPVMEQCSGRLAGEEETLPIKKKAKPPRVEKRLVALIPGVGIHEGKLLVRQRPETGLLAGMWELPHVQMPDTSEVYGESWRRAMLADALNQEMINVQPSQWLMQVEHIFSHIRWDMDVYECRTTVSSVHDDPSLPEGWKWMGEAEREKVAFPNVFLRIMDSYKSNVHSTAFSQ